MIERDYYPLEEAAEILEYKSIAPLIEWAGKGKLDIAVLVGGHAITKKTIIDSTGSEVAVSFGGFPGAVVKIEQTCIQSYEAGLPARVTLVIYYGRDGGNSEVLTIVDPMEEDGDLMKAGDFMMKDAKLVIMAADLKRLQNPDPDESEQPIENMTVGDEVTHPRKGGYYERDKAAIDLVGKRPELLSLRPAGIKKELQAADSVLFAGSGYDTWWRSQKIFPKGKPGTNKSTGN